MAARQPGIHSLILPFYSVIESQIPAAFGGGSHGIPNLPYVNLCYYAQDQAVKSNKLAQQRIRTVDDNCDNNKAQLFHNRMN